MSFPEVISIVKDVLVGVAAATTAVAAVIGLRSWSRELKGKAEFEAARNLARATYKVRDALSDCRSPFYSGGEFPEGTAWGRQGDQGEADKWAYVYKNRFDPVKDAIREFDSDVLEAEALWGSKIKAKTSTIRSYAQELYAAMQADVDDKRSHSENFKHDSAFKEQVKRKVTFMPDDKTNKFSKMIKKVVEEIEDEMRPYLRRNKSRLLGFGVCTQACTHCKD
jgi:hypothetical protein